MKQLIRIGILLLCAVLLFSSCGKKEDITERPKVAISFGNLKEPFFTDVKSGIERRAADSNLTLLSVDAQKDSSKQLTDITNMLAGEPDLLIVHPLEKEKVQSILEACRAANIKILILDVEPEGEYAADGYMKLDPSADGKETGVSVAQKAEYMLGIGREKNGDK
ncbi:substrate-binding domain-containing protein [Acetivibrio sp. MSJd-27]|jgi:ribose transport system substrate-binding protein|uniref:substrate-binding domain-containing protein n=1 Tax=Acetivibrio sp. MSJd-27 TaxID=2841523 RepID=UPI001C10FEE1|nr:substrate-binding domain-containing protein [Acetivibrio sp. MSJd-27]MBU5449471.1 substrate-binding domain-containing protein [Acetivibrio sp. MSJd-27]